MLSSSSSSSSAFLSSTSGCLRDGISYIKADEASKIDELLMATPGFSIEQLMELAGLAVAQSAHDFIIPNTSQASKKILVLAGPGNNGGDGLVAARHLSQFGHALTVVLPKESRSSLFVNLKKQCEDLLIPVLSSLPEQVNAACGRDFDLIVDALFGFSFKGPAREPFSALIAYMTNANTNTPVLSIDIPSGWDVNEGDIHSTKFLPSAVVSLTAPKVCMREYKGVHYLGGRFVPPNIATQFALSLPSYQGSDQIIRIDNEKLRKLASVGVSAVFTTTPSIELAEAIAKSLVGRKLCACVNIIPTVKSIYEWEGKVEEGSEALLMIKTQTSLVDELVAAIKDMHTYSVPEAIALDVTGGNIDYIDWVLRQTTHTKKGSGDT